MSRIFLQLLNMSLTAGYVILVIFLLRALLRKAPKAYSYALWAVALFRLLCPFSLESGASLLAINPQPLPPAILEESVPRIASGLTLVDQAVNQALTAPSPEGAAAVGTLRFSLEAGALLWLAGFAALLGYGAYSVLRLGRALRSADFKEGNVYEAANIQTPFVFGLLRPKIYLPAGLREPERGYVLCHERVHLRRHDHLFKALAYFTLCLHWFNPLVWLAFFAMSRDMEMSCDERVLREIGGGIKKEYSASLLALAQENRGSAFGPLAFGGCDAGKRIKNVLNYKRPAFWAAAALLAVVAAVGLGLLLNPAGDSAGGPESGGAGGDSAGGLAFPYSLGVSRTEIVEQAPAGVGSLLEEGGAGQIHLPNQAAHELEVELLMTGGRLWRADDPDFVYGGYFQSEENYVGDFELVARLDGEETSRLAVSFPDADACFYGPVELVFQDLEGDGSLEFTLGTWLWSAGKTYNIYRADAAGRLSLVGNIGRYDALEPSIFLEQTEDGSLLLRYWDQVSGQYEDEEQSLEGLAATGTGLPEPPEPGAAEELAVRFLSDERFRGCTPLLWTPAEDGAYGLTGVVLYEDSRENNVCNLAFALDTYFHPLCFAVNEREGQRDFDILEDSQLTYLGEGKVGVSVKRIGTDEIYDYQISYSAGAAEGVGNVHFTASSQLRE